MGKSSFIWNSYRNGSTENDDHRAAKMRIGDLLLSRGWSVRYEKELEISEDWHPVADIYAAHPDKAQTICCELDGQAHNTTPRKHGKDKSRDRALAEKGIITVRYLVEDVNGFKFKGTGKYYRLADEEILARIEAHLP